MRSAIKTIEPLMQVSLSLRAGPAVRGNATTTETSLTFVCGIGVSGLTPFEQALSGKTTGDRVRLEIDQDRFGAFFGHLGCSVVQALNMEPPVHLDVTVQALERVSERDLVKAMAQMSGCGGGCGCGCG